MAHRRRGRAGRRSMRRTGHRAAHLAGVRYLQQNPHLDLVAARVAELRGHLPRRVLTEARQLPLVERRGGVIAERDGGRGDGDRAA